MSTTTSPVKEYAKYTPKMLKMIMNRFRLRTSSQSQMDVATQLLTDFKSMWPTSDNINKLTASSILQKHSREDSLKTVKKLNKKLKAKQAIAATPKKVKTEPVSATLRGYAIQKVLAADDITITEVGGKLTITL
tara:strand:+ start:129 stop:530 length:402 start_codon:yes stop_codon:yes gene_type:complete